MPTRVLSWLMLAGIVGVILAQLHDIGWLAVWAERPSSPLFYALLVVAYFVLPVADVMIYRRLWGLRFWRALPVFLRKRVFNSVLVGYSGELVLMLWARRNVAKNDALIAHDIKDSNILSAVVSTYVSAALVVYVALSLHLIREAQGTLYYSAIATIAMAALVPVALIRFRAMIRLSRRDQLVTFGIHAVRFLLGQLLVLAQWSVALPQVEWGQLMALLALQLLISRLPFIPSRDLLFISAGISLSHSLALPPAALASLLIVSNALQQVLHLLVFLAVSLDLPAKRGLEQKPCE